MLASQNKMYRFEKKLSNALYFRKIRRNERLSVLNGFRAEASAAPDKEALTGLYKAKSASLLESHRLSVFKIVSFVQPLVGTLFAILGILFFALFIGAPVGSAARSAYGNVSTNCLFISGYVTPPAVIVAFILNISLGRSNPLECKYHYPAIAAHIISVITLWLFVLYEVGKALSGF